MEVIFPIVAVIAVFSIGANICLSLVIQENKINLSLLEMYRNDYKLLKRRYDQVVQEYLKLRYKAMEPYNRNTKVSSDTLEAVKYAMNKAHPDNGGDAEKFMRYKKCYDELRGEK